MKTSALIPLIFSVSAGLAHAAQPPSLNQPPVTHFGPATCDSDPDGRAFAEKACFTTFDPTQQIGFGANYKPPVCAGSTPLTGQQKDILAKAYARAPDYMKAKLCGLTQMFVVEASTDAKAPKSSREYWQSFGFWEGSDRPPGRGVFVGISARDLMSEESFADAENRTVNALLGFVPGPQSAPLPGLRSSGAQDPTFTLLGKLAHELGHAILADTNADGTNKLHPRRHVSGPPRSSCFEYAILGASWNANKFHANMERWIKFGDQHNNRLKNPEISPSLDKLRSSVRSGKIAVASDAIQNIYRSKQFVNVLASERPEEDLVQTYTYKVLADAAQSQPLVFPLPGGDVSVFDLLGSDILAQKVKCLRELGFLPAQP